MKQRGGGTLYPDSYCSHSHREANTGREMVRPECANRQSLGGHSEWKGFCVPRATRFVSFTRVRSEP